MILRVSLALAAVAVLSFSCVGPAPSPCTQCGEVCIDIKTDSANCGSCGNLCGAGKVCTDGACVATCPTGQKQCGSACTDTKTDRLNCGACNVSCTLGQSCEGGTCVTSCPPDQRVCGSSCANVNSDRLNCGACGTTCAAGEVCGNGHCSVSCPGAQTACNGSCVDTMTDRANCGQCGMACGAGLVCVAGSCAPQCAAPLIFCNGTCVDPRNDAANCSGCGMTCSAQNATAVCVAQSCSYTACTAGFASCDNVNSNGCETDLSTLTDCGGCGVACAPRGVAAATCTAGACGYTTCAVSTDGGVSPQDCDGIAANGCETTVSTDLNHCGACNRRCPINSACVAGQCQGNTGSFSSGTGDDVFQQVSRPRSHTLMVGYEPGSFINYTFDGTKPVPDAGTTRSVVTPLMIPGVDAGTLRWFASLPDGGREPDEHTLVQTIGTPPFHDLGGYLESVRMTSPITTSGSPYVVASPGQTITLNAIQHVWKSDAQGYCPTCVLVPAINVDGVGQVFCPGPYTGGPFPGFSGAVNVTFTAPSAPGRYYVRYVVSLSFNCGQAGGGGPVGVVIVR